MQETQNPGMMLEIAGLAAQIILENGAETYRVEDTVMRLCHSYGFVRADVIALSTGVFISVADGGSSQAALRRVGTRNLNLARVNAVNDLSRRIAEGAVPMDAALALLQKIRRSETIPAWREAALAGLSAGCFTLMFGGGLIEMGIALLCGVLVQVISGAIRRADNSLVLVSLVGGMLCSLLTMAGYFIFHLTPAGVETTLAGAIMPLISGLMMTNAVRDSLRGDLLSGLARGMEALLVAIMVALGISLMLQFYLSADVDMVFATPPPWYLAVAYAGVATMFFCPLLKAPPSSILPASLLGALAYAGFLFMRDGLLMGEAMSLFIASAAVAVLCEALARRMRMIATVFLCAALIPLVPGLGLYRTMRELLLGEYQSALTMGLTTLFAVGAIALGAAIGSLRLHKKEGEGRP